jgi:hypothetical protein
MSKKRPTDRRMIAAAIVLRGLLKQMKFSLGAEVATTGYLFGLLLREAPADARGAVLEEFNDFISRAEDEAA